MKHFNTIKGLALGSMMAVAGLANAQQVVRPYSYPPGAGTSSNFYANYVGVRFQVTTPAVIAGDKAYTHANTWGGALASLSDTVKFSSTDSDGCVAFPAGYFTGKIALIWRGTCEFGAKALAAQNAGAVAVVLVNNVAGGPVGMAAGAVGASVTIPVFMISVDDGKDITAQLRGGNTVVLNVVANWGNNFRNDLGFVPTGYAVSAYNALPMKQINDPRHPVAYVQKDGAFVANYGTSGATRVKVRADLNFMTSETSSTLLHSDSVILSSFPAADSIWAMFMNKYDLPATATTGKYDLKYTISSDSADQFLGDNVLHYYFYATDSLYSKGRYDFANNRPFTTIYTGPSTLATDPYIWTVPYYISVGGGNFNTAQFSVVNGGPALLPADDPFLIYVFRWVDAPIGATPADSFMEVSELQLVGAGLKVFNGTSDSSFQTFTVNINDSLGSPADIHVDSNSWYLMGAECPFGYSLGCDGLINGYPRAFGLRKFDGIYEFYNPIWFGDRRNSSNSTSGELTNMVSNPGFVLYPWAFDGTGSFIVDSVAFDNQKGLIPSIAFTTTRAQVSVKNTQSPFASFELYPNPTTDVINVKLELRSLASTVNYSIIDNGGRIMHKAVHHNVQNDMFTYSTSSLAPGMYYVVVASSEGKVSFKKFTVAK